MTVLDDLRQRRQRRQSDRQYGFDGDRKKYRLRSAVTLKIAGAEQLGEGTLNQRSAVTSEKIRGVIGRVDSCLIKHPVNTFNISDVYNPFMQVLHIKYEKP